MGAEPALSVAVRVRAVYAALALVIFIIEVCIALYMHDAFIRPYVGDVLAVGLVYCGLRAITPLGRWPAVAISFLIACAVEFGQYLNILDMLGLRGNALARVVLGVGFEPEDFLAYAAGAGLVVLAEMVLRPRP